MEPQTSFSWQDVNLVLSRSAIGLWKLNHATQELELDEIAKLLLAMNVDDLLSYRRFYSLWPSGSFDLFMNSILHNKEFTTALPYVLPDGTNSELILKGYVHPDREGWIIGTMEKKSSGYHSTRSNVALPGQKQTDGVEDLLKSMFDNTIDAVWSVDDSFRVSYFNETIARSLLQSFGIRLELGQSILEEFAGRNLPDIEKKFRNRYQRAFAGESFIEIDHYVLMGKDVHLEVKLSPMKKEGRIIGACIISRNVTEREEAKLNLIREKNFVSTILDTSGSLIILLQTDGSIELFNPACQKCTGYTAEEVKGRVFWDFLILPEEREGVKETFYALESGHFPSRFENYWLTKNGEKRWIAWDNSIILDAKGQIQYVVGTGIDITASKEAEHLLKVVSERLSSAFENSRTAFYIYDALLDEQSQCVDFVLRDVNKMGMSVLNKPVSSIIGEKMSQIAPISETSGMLAKFIEVYTTGIPLEAEVQIESENLKPGWIHIACVKLEKGIFIAFDNISEQKQQEAVRIEALEKERQLNEALALREAELQQLLSEQVRLNKALIQKDSQLNEAQRIAAMCSWEWHIPSNTGYVSDNFYTIYGLPPGPNEVGPEAIMLPIHPDDREYFVQQLQKGVDTMATQQVVFRSLWPDQQIKNIQAIFTVFTNEQGQPEKILGNSQDITERKISEDKINQLLSQTQAANQALKVNEEELRQAIHVQQQLLTDLQEKEANLTALLNNTSNIIFSLDRQYKLVAYNEPFRIASLYEFKISPAIGLPLEAYQSNLLFADTKQYIEQALQGRKSVTEVRYITSRGEEKYLELSYNPIVALPDHILGVSLIIRDITDVKHAQMALQESEMRFRIISRISNDAMWDWDMEQNQIKWSTGYAGIYGFDPSTIVYAVEMWEEILHPEDKKRVLDKMYTCIQDVEQQEWEDQYRIVRSDGEIAWVSDKGYIMRNTKGEAYRMLGGMRDISAMKLAEKELQESELIFRLISEVSTDAVWDWKLPEDNVRYLTGFDTVSQFVAFDSDHRTGFWDESLHPDDKARVLNHLQMTLAQPEAEEFEEEYRIYRQDGNISYVLEKARIIRDAEGKAIRVLGGMKDMTQIREQQNKISEALQKEQLLNEELASREEELSSSEEELRQLNEQLTRNYEVLREKDSILTQAHNIAKIGSWAVNLSTHTAYWSDELLYIFEEESPDRFDLIYNCPCFDEVSARRLQVAYQTLISTGDNLDLMLPVLTHTNTRKWIRMTAYPTWEDSRVVKVTGIVQDITDLKQTEQKLKSSEEKYAKAFDLSPELILLIRESDFVVVEANQRTERIAGYTKEEVIGKTTMSFNIWVNPQEREEFFRQYNQAKKVDLEATLRKKDESWFDAAISASCVEIESQHYMLAVIRDITERKTAQKKIKQSENNLHAIINNSDMSIWSIDTNYHIIARNEVFKALVQNSFHFELQPGDHALDARLSEDLTTFWAPLYKRALQGERIIDEVHTENISYEYSLKPILVDNELTGVTIYLKDITEYVKKEEKIRQQALEMAEINKKIGEYRLMALRSAMNPHFIFNSLNSIQYFIAKNDKKNAITYMSVFSKLIRGILNSSVQNKVNLSNELELLKYYIELELLRFDNKFEVIYHIDASLDMDGIQVPSLLIQPFVENAILHGLYNKQGKGVLTIAVRLDEDVLLFEVEDDGIGLEAAAALKSRQAHTSVGMMLTKERLAIINQEHKVSVEVIDLYKQNSFGTKVRIFVKI